jgi:DNA-directed RNA polymerase specialized sigma24 family protein
MSEHRELPDDPELRELRSRFLNSLGRLRPALHRFCSHMCGSVLEGEDLVQETLAAASYMVSPANRGFLDPSLFEMALARCLYFIELDLGQRERTRVVRIRDYMHIQYVLRDARIEPMGELPEVGSV